MPYRDDDEALRARHDLLSQLRIATPCDASWDAMAGDDRVRHCGLCDRKVYDLSRLTSAEAIQLLADSGERLPCIRLHRRRDGTVITADCERGRKTRKRRLAIAVASAVCTVAAATSGPRALDVLLPPPIEPCEFRETTLLFGEPEWPPDRGVDLRRQRDDAEHARDIEEATRQVDELLLGALGEDGSGSRMGRIATIPRRPGTADDVAEPDR